MHGLGKQTHKETTREGRGLTRGRENNRGQNTPSRRSNGSTFSTENSSGNPRSANKTHTNRNDRQAAVNRRSHFLLTYLSVLFLNARFSSI